MFHSPAIPFSPPVMLKNWLLAGLAAGVLSGCASVFDAPYEELEAEVLSTPAVPVEVDSDDMPALVQPEKEYADIWARIRDGLTVSQMDRDPVVERVARRFATDRMVERVSQRAAGLLYYVVDAVGQRQLPMELVFVPFVESGYSLQAASHAEAHGAWQFIESTAKNYEIGIDRFRDDRRNLVASTRAALDYLQVLHGMFNDWPLAMAAYNCGEKRVQAEVDRARQRGVRNPRFNDIARQLPPETREYVPRILAIRKLVAQPEAYRVALPQIDNAPQYTVVTMHRDIDVALAARLAGMTLEGLRQLNPSLAAPIILGRHNTPLLLPPAAARRLAESIETHPGPWVTWRMLRITRAASPAEIARRNRISLATVLQANPLPEGHFYDVGSTLMLPGRGSDAVDPQSAERAVLLTRAASTCALPQCQDDGSARTVPTATVNGLPRR